MYKHRVKRKGGGAAIRIFYNLSLRTSHYLSPEGGLGGRFFFFGGGGHKVLKGKGRQQSLRRTVEHLLPINCQ